MNKWLIICLIIVFQSLNLSAQPYAPGADDLGTSAIFKDSSVFVMWAKSVVVDRGPIDISNLGLGLASFGLENDALGKADGKVLSLGDGGVVTLKFDYPISNGVGPDFAIFENSFNNTFLELAFVEVSSDGLHFVRFPAISLLQNTVQFGNDASMDPSKINNLAGKYRGGYGTPFDLDELKDSLNLDVESISFIRLVDVVGTIDTKYGTEDVHGNLINDPYPTPYPSCGFDLDAVGVINSKLLSTYELGNGVEIYPNPTNDVLHLNLNTISRVKILDVANRLVEEKVINYNGFIDLSNQPKGSYYLFVEGKVLKIILV